MRIITMATESYSNWLYHFLSSVKEKVCVYAINFSKNTLKQFKQEFPEVIFEEYNSELTPRQKNNPLGNVFLVTHLKGLFMKKAWKKFKTDLLWIDCTELIRFDLSELSGTFRFKRDGQTAKTKTYCAIFGMDNEKIIYQYANLCEESNDWFSDQISLAKLDMEEREKGDWISFHYSENAKSWSDRGKTGKGTLTKEDCNYTEERYIKELQQSIINYRKHFEEFKDKIKKIKVLVFTDDGVWCFANSVNKICSLLKDKYEFTIIYNARQQRDLLLNWNGDFVWSRCGSFRLTELTQIRPDLKNRIFASVTTGGEYLINRANRNVAGNFHHPGMIVQNKEAKFMCQLFLKKQNRELPIFILPNGCDTKKFTYKKSDKFIIGFNGRATDNLIKTIKGYSYFELAKEHLNFESEELLGKNKIPFNEMPNYYHRISLLVLPSHAEGCSNTINESLAAGVPVLAYKTGWHGEVMKEQTDGIIWIRRDIRDITAKIKYLMENPQLLKNLSENALSFAKRNTWEKMSIVYDKAFREMYLLTKNLPKIKNEIKLVLENPNTIKVQAIQRCNLGKLERVGPTYWFEKDTIRKVPYFGSAKKIVDQHLEGRFLKLIK